MTILSPVSAKPDRFAKLLICICVALLTACSTTAHYPVNPPMLEHEAANEYRYRNLETGKTSDSLALMLSFSGGGTRAAALAHGVLEEMAETSVFWDGKKRILVDEIDAISSVSGGSIVAANFVLHPDRHFSDFPESFLYKDMQTSIKDRIFSLEILPLLGSSTYGRIEIVAEKLDKSLFHGATYQDLVKRRKKPFLIINATDMSSGARFPFTQEQFDLICADLNAIPLARAVSASAALPIVFSPLTLRNYASTCSNASQRAVRRDLPDLSMRQKRRLHELRSYLDETHRPYLHLLDGGLVDNLGIFGSFDSTMLSGGAAGLIREMGFEKLRKVVFIVVSAETDPVMDADSSPDVPSMRRVSMALDIPIHQNSMNSMIQFKENILLWQKELKQKTGKEVAFYVIEVSLRDIKDTVERDSFRTIPTSLRLPKTDVDRLRQAGRRLLRESPEMQRMLRDMKADQ